MYYKNIAIPEFSDTFFQQRHMQEWWNKNMASHFDPSWVSVLYKSIQKWINPYTCPRWMFVPSKPHPFWNDYQKIVCAKSRFIYNVDIMEKRDQPIVINKNQFEQKGEMAGFMLRTKKSLWGTGKVVVMDTGFFVLE